MDDRLDMVLGEKLGHRILVAEIAEDQRHVVRHGGAEAGREIVKHDHLLAGGEKFEHRVAADGTGAARDENGHAPLSSPPCQTIPSGDAPNLCQPHLAAALAPNRAHETSARPHPLDDSMAKRNRKAVFPVAGLGTRFLPATKSVPKEMLTVVDRPVLQHVVEEAKEAGLS